MHQLLTDSLALPPVATCCPRRSSLRSTAPTRGLRNLRDVYQAVANHPECAEIRWALKRLEALKGPLDAIPALAPAVRANLKMVDPTRDGLPHREFGRVKKLVGDALRHCRLEKMPNRFEVPLTAAWKRLLKSVPRRPYKLAIERFARWASMRENAVPPHEVRAVDFDRFGDDLLETTRPDLARNVYLALCNAWDRAVDAYTHWPRVRPNHALRRLWFTLPFDAYPKRLGSEIDRMFKQRREADGHPSSPWRAPIGPAAERTQRHYLRLFLHACVQTGRSPDKLTTLAVVLDHRYVRNAMDWLLLRKNDNEPTLALYNLTVLLRSIARHWLPHHRARCDELDYIVGQFFDVLFPCGRRVISPRTRDLLIEFEHAPLRDSLLDLGQRILVRHGHKIRLTRAEALEVQGALAITLAIALVLGPTQLAALRLGRDIVCRAGRAAVFKAKGREIIDEELPGPLSALIDLYCSKARNRAQPVRGKQLFPGKAGPKLPVVLARQMAKLAERELAIRLTASQFKYLPGVLHLKREPEAYELVRDLGGHRTVEVVQEVFGQLDDQGVHERFDRMLARATNQSVEVA